MLNDDFIKTLWLQSCGDSVKVIKKSNKKDKKGSYFWEIEFIKYPYKTLAQKGNIIRGTINNPRIEQEEFINKLWLQNCGDILQIIKKTDKKYQNNYYWECEFQKYPYKILALKGEIIRGTVLNPQIEQIEFIDKIWPQNCGDSLKIIRKSNKKYNISSSYLWEAEFIKYPYKVFATKRDIVLGNIFNPKLPWRNKQNLIKYIEENFKNKPSIQELANSFDLCYVYINKIINNFKLNDFIDYNYLGEENQVRDFIKSIYNGEVIKYSGKKEDNYYEIDIYLPELKKGIEYNGSIWHKEENKNFGGKQIGYHKKKQEFFAEKGINILFVWDYEWFEDFPKRQIVNNQIKQRIREFLKI